MLKLIICEWLILGGSVGIIVGAAIMCFMFTELFYKKCGRRHFF